MVGLYKFCKGAVRQLESPVLSPQAWRGWRRCSGEARGPRLRRLFGARLQTCCQRALWARRPWDHIQESQVSQAGTLVEVTIGSGVRVTELTCQLCLWVMSSSWEGQSKNCFICLKALLCHLHLLGTGISRKWPWSGTGKLCCSLPPSTVSGTFRPWFTEWKRDACLTSLWRCFLAQEVTPPPHHAAS